MKIIMDVKLKNFEDEINRVICTDDSFCLRKFCEAIILSMNGKIRHDYNIKHNDKIYFSKGYKIKSDNEFLISHRKVSTFNVQKNDKLILTYDSKCNWEFIMTIKEINECESNKLFTVFSGIGKGIIEDCGGIWHLEQLSYGDPDIDIIKWYIDKDDLDYNINDFNLEKLNNKLDELYNKKEK